MEWINLLPSKSGPQSLGRAAAPFPFATIAPASCTAGIHFQGLHLQPGAQDTCTKGGVPERGERESSAIQRAVFFSKDGAGTVVRGLEEKLVEARMADNSQVLAISVAGAIIGGIAGYLFFTDQGRAARRKWEPALKDLSRELNSLRQAAEAASSMAGEGWKVLNDIVGDVGRQPRRFTGNRQASPFSERNHGIRPANYQSPARHHGGCECPPGPRSDRRRRRRVHGVRRVMRLANILDERHVTPAMFRDNAILDDVKRVTETVKQETERVDHAIQTTINRVDNTVGRVRWNVRATAIRLVGLIRGVRAATENLHSDSQREPGAGSIGRVM